MSCDAPSTWLLLGHKAGDNNQVHALQEELGWPAVEKRIRYRAHELATNLLLRVTLAGIDRNGSDGLEGPWPDLVLTSGRRNEPVARWIRKQSGGHTRLVHIGRPWAHPRHWDLVVTTPQYDVPRLANVLTNDLPLHRLSKESLAEAAEEWRPRFDEGELPRPWLAVLVGGNSGPYVLDRRNGERLGRAVAALAKKNGGSVLATTSARSSPEAVGAFVKELADLPTHLFRWGDDPARNPYRGYLALADEFVVTGESMSMLTEACFTGRPVHIFDLGLNASLRWKPLSHYVGTALGPRRMARDVTRIHRRLVADHRAVFLGNPWPGTPSTEPSQDLTRAAARVRALFKNFHTESE